MVQGAAVSKSISYSIGYHYFDHTVSLNGQILPNFVHEPKSTTTVALFQSDGLEEEERFVLEGGQEELSSTWM
jgi:hypothetical protein